MQVQAYRARAVLEILNLKLYHHFFINVAWSSGSTEQHDTLQHEPFWPLSVVPASQVPPGAMSGNMNTTIQFDDDANQIRRARSRETATATGADLNDGIVSMERAMSKGYCWLYFAQVFARTVSMGRRSSRGQSMDPIYRAKTMDAEDPEESGLRRPGDYKQKQIFRGTQLFLLAYQSIGVIYGDIGTSPLYVFSSVFGSTAPARDDLIGVLSLIIWSLTIMVTVVRA
jgi:hypothetical protein